MAGAQCPFMTVAILLEKYAINFVEMCQYLFVTQRHGHFRLSLASVMSTKRHFLTFQMMIRKSLMSQKKENFINGQEESKYDALEFKLGITHIIRHLQKNVV